MTQENIPPQDEVPAQEDTMNEDVSFAEMFDESQAAQERLEPGQKLEAEVVRISKEWVFLDLGGKSEGALALSELIDDQGVPTVKEGDKIEVYFLTVERNEKIFTTKISGVAAKAHLEEAFHSGIPVDGTVVKETKGGFEVKIAGSSRAFCPYSQIGLRRVSDSEQYIGEQLPFLIIEYKEGGRNIIVSHRKILEMQRLEQKEALKETLEVGQAVRGTITSVRDFGAFVDIGGIEGLIPISEIGWERVTDIQAVLEEGQQVEVAVKKLDWENDRYSFSLKDRIPDPWQNCTLQEGSVMTATVARLVDFGAFVTLVPGIDGLIHISNLGSGRRINHPREILAKDQEVEVRIDAIDLENKRISLSLANVEEQAKTEKKKGRSAKDDDMRQEFKKFKNKGAVGKETSMGTFGDLLKAKLDK